jgi:hypothetical protein
VCEHIEAERIGSHVGTEQYGTGSVSPRPAARPPGNNGRSQSRWRAHLRTLMVAANHPR